MPHWRNRDSTKHHQSIIHSCIKTIQISQCLLDNCYYRLWSSNAWSKKLLKIWVSIGWQNTNKYINFIKNCFVFPYQSYCNQFESLYTPWKKSHTLSRLHLFWPTYSNSTISPDDDQWSTWLTLITFSTMIAQAMVENSQTDEKSSPISSLVYNHSAFG